MFCFYKVTKNIGSFLCAIKGTPLMQQANAERAFTGSSAQRLTVTAEARISRRWCLSVPNRMSSENSLQFYWDFKHRNFLVLLLSL